jgi:hypothetical protein
MQILLPAILPRAEYSIRLVVEQLLGIELEFIYDAIHINKQCLVYGGEPVPNLPYLSAHPLIAEDCIREINPVVSNWNATLCFFPSSANSFIPFDIFTATFWLVSRYEEYLPYKSDIYGRFPAKESHAYKNNYLSKPVVNIWANMLGSKLIELFPSIKISKPSFRFIPTVDVDSLYLYRHKGILRGVGGMSRDIFSGNVQLLKTRISILLRRKPDPWDCLQTIEDMHSGLELTFFLLLAKYGKYDKASGIKTLEFRNEINRILINCNIGIHPGMAGHGNNRLWDAEFNRYNKLAHKNPEISRQHFLKVLFPETYLYLISKGILHDYSLAYPECLGFRAGIASPFSFFNLISNQVEALTIWPVAIMDVTLKDYLNYPPKEALDAILKIYYEVQQVQGVLTSLWHNESLSGYGAWSGWNTVYEKFIEQIRSDAN